MSEQDAYVALLNEVHELMGDFCLKADDGNPGNVVCFDVADGLWRKGYRRVEREAPGDAG